MLNETLNDKELIDKISEVLEEKNSMLKISIDDKEKLIVEEIKKDNLSDKTENIKSVGDFEKNEKTKTNKVIKSLFKIFESFFDSVAKNFLKKKYKINNSVYNDGKKAIVAICDKDSRNFLKKASDVVLNLIKNIPTDKKKIIKNTKNVAIDEIYSWKI